MRRVLGGRGRSRLCIPVCAYKIFGFHVAMMCYSVWFLILLRLDFGNGVGVFQQAASMLRALFLAPKHELHHQKHRVTAPFHLLFNYNVSIYLLRPFLANLNRLRVPRNLVRQLIPRHDTVQHRRAVALTCPRCSVMVCWSMLAKCRNIPLWSL